VVVTAEWSLFQLVFSGTILNYEQTDGVIARMF